MNPDFVVQVKESVIANGIIGDVGADVNNMNDGSKKR